MRITVYYIASTDKWPITYTAKKKKTTKVNKENKATNKLQKQLS